MRYLSVLISIFMSWSLPALADGLPDRQQMAELVGSGPSEVVVYEPHLTTDKGPRARSYLGWPFADVAKALFGANWRDQGDTIEFRALDGYVSRVSIADFQAHSAWLVSGLPDGGQFTVDNLLQNEANIPLGPYYLVWENIEDQDIFERGASLWPYQVAEILPIDLSTAALLPEGLDPGLAKGAEIARTYCLNCHTLNGFGGEKVPGDLAALAAAFDAKRFRALLLNPRAQNPDTTMPAIAPSRSEADRIVLISQLRSYLLAMPKSD